MQKDTTDLPLFSDAVFHGAGYDKQKDHDRLSGNMRKVYDVMADHQRHTLREISERTGVPEASASACLRTLRNQYGYVIDKERVGHEAAGTWQYWIAAGGMGVHSRAPRKMKPIGDPELFGQMMRQVYAIAKAGRTPLLPIDFVYGASTADAFHDCVAPGMDMAALKWLHDMVLRVKKAGA